MLNDYADFLKKTLEENHYPVNSFQQDQLLHFLHLLQKWNQRFNLTAIHEPKDMIMLHIMDSLSVHYFLYGIQIIDVGTVAVFQGLPLSILYPEKLFTLFDSNNKKTRFLTHVVSALKLSNIKIIHQRVEHFSGYFDTIITRALAPLEKILIMTQHLTDENGYFLAMGGNTSLVPAFNFLKFFSLFMRATCR